MSTSIKTCPSCSSLILSDTSECPECGTVFDKKVAEANAVARASIEMKTQNMYDNCKKCGSSVRSGLVRCWSCRSFMRKDVEEKYAEMMALPQKVIYSEQSDRDDKEELIPARITSKGEEVYDAVGDDDGFQLRSGVSSTQTENDSSTDEFELDTTEAAVQQPAVVAKAKPTPAVEQAAPSASPPPAPAPAPAATAPATAEPVQQSTAANPTEAASVVESSESANQPVAENSNQAVDDSEDKKKNVNDDEFVNLALSDVKETNQRKRRKIEQSRRRRVLVPCTTCGAWIRVFQDQAGRTVRCQKCKTPFIVPQIRKKSKKDSPQQSATTSSAINLEWVENVSLHVVNPADIVLKPGSLDKGSEPADVAFHEGQMYVVKFDVPAKKGLFGKPKGADELSAQRSQIRDAIGRAGKLDSIPVGECLALPSEQSQNVKLAQPVAEAHASMFAGVPVFGPGRIAVYLPIAQPDGRQAYLSMTVSQGRRMAAALQNGFGIDLQLGDNGVPMTEQKEMLKCKLAETPVEAVRNVAYYENDPEFELELTGHRCGTCKIVVSEDARARKKLGGAAGKGIAKAKCPGCAAKMGTEKTYRIIAARPEEVDTDEAAGKS